MTDEKTMSTERALKLALEALELAKRSYGMMLLSSPPQEAWKTYRVDDAISKAITALREALKSVPDWASEAIEQPAQQQEPVAWRVWRGDAYELFFSKYAADRRADCFTKRPDVEPLYTSPPAQRTWVGLTEPERLACYDLNPARFASAIEAKLKEKNT